MLVILLQASLFALAQREVEIDLPGDVENWEPKQVYAYVDSAASTHQNNLFLQLSYFKYGFGFAQEVEDFQSASHYSNNMAWLLSSIGLHESALFHSLESYQYAQRTEDLHDDVWALFRLSGAHIELNQQELATQEAKQSLSLAQQTENPTDIGWAYNMVGEVFRNFHELDSAISNFEKGMRYLEAAGFLEGFEVMRHNKGIALAEMGEHDAALEILSLDLESNFSNAMEGKLEKGLAMVQILTAKEELPSALAVAKEMLLLAQSGGLLKWELKFLQVEGELLKESGEWDLAWQARAKADSMEEEITGKRVKLQSSLFEQQYNLNSINEEKALLEAQNRTSRLISIAVASISLLLLVIAIILVTYNRRSRKTNRALARQNKRMDELLEEKDTWMNLMAHDLKAPLNSIQGLLKVAQNPDTPTQVRDKVFEHIQTAIGKGTELITQLLELAQVESEQFRVKAQPTDLKQLVEGLRSTFLPSATDKNIQIATELPAAHLQLDTDPTVVTRILENFMSNALKFSSPGTIVRISLTKTPSQTTISISDQGPGISAEEQKQLFDKFTKLSARPTAGESSTGLGLSIVKTLADKLQADIKVESELGKGSTFSLCFPR